MRVLLRKRGRSPIGSLAKRSHVVLREMRRRAQRQADVAQRLGDVSQDQGIDASSSPEDDEHARSVGKEVAMSHLNPTTEQLREVARSEANRIERQAMTDVDRRYYDMRHPYWREELHEYMKTCAATKNVVKVD